MGGMNLNLTDIKVHKFSYFNREFIGIFGYASQLTVANIPKRSTEVVYLLLS